MENKDISISKRWWQNMVLPPDHLKELRLAAAPTVFRARLKRCETAEAAMMTEGFRALWFNLPEGITKTPDRNKTAKNMECWATIAAALADVAPGEPSKGIAFAAGQKSDGDKPIVSELRFAQLQAADNPADLLTRLRRILKQIKGQVSPESLIRDIKQWFDEHYAPFPRSAENRIAVRWAMDYYRAAAKK
jgi:CRISPR system Cascade subunit CasB